jgi:hypothetical protein
MRIGHRCKCRHGDLSHGSDKKGPMSCGCAGCTTLCSRNETPELLPTFDGKGNTIERIVPPGDQLSTEGTAGGPRTCDCDACQALYAELTEATPELAGA